MRKLRRWRGLAAIMAWINVFWNLLLFAVNPAWGSLVLAGIWMLAGSAWTALSVSAKRRDRADATYEFLMRPQPKLPDPFRQPGRTYVLEPGERIFHLPQGFTRVETPRGTRYIRGTRAIRECSHWPRDEVKLADGTTVAYICRRCDHNWANEDYVRKGVEW